MKVKTCKKSSGKRMNPSQKDAKKLASIKKSSHWAIVSSWEGFIPFANSELDSELSWAKSQLLAFQQAKLGREENGHSIYEGAAKEAPAYDARREAIALDSEELAIAECDLSELNNMIAVERLALSETSSEEGKTLRKKNLEVLLTKREELVSRVHSLRMALRRARTVGGWNYKEWDSYSLGSAVKPKAKAKAPKAKAKAKAKAPTKPVISAKAEMKARKSRELRLQRVEAAARKAALEAAERQLEAAVRKELNKILAERRAKLEAERKAAIAAEKARLEAARKAAAAKKAEAERKAQRARERAEERKLFSSVYNATLRTTLSRMVREEVARQLAAA